MSLIQPFLWSGLLILACMLALWLLSLILKNASIVDIFWGLGFVLVAWFTRWQVAPIFETISAESTAQSFLRSGLIVTLVTLWGLRLSLHIFLRNHNKPEDFRYAAWREQYGRIWWLRSLFHVFLLQGVLLWLVAFPVIVAQLPRFGGFPRPLDWLGALVWALGFFFETLGNWQLVQFKKNPANKGKLLTSGLWKYTRHPNYFGDAAQWWGFYLFALSAGAWWTIFSPVIMTFLLMRVSGVAMLERTLQIRPGYEEYMPKTNAFFPWWPKKSP